MKIIGYQNKEELFKYLRENKDIICMQKKAQMKQADAIDFVRLENTDKNIVIKSEDSGENNNDTLTVKAVINTTNYIDSHLDLHVPGLWKKSLQEKRKMYLLEQHNHTHRGIISDEVKATTEMLNFKDLGQKYDGETQALIFEAKINKSDNEFMFEKYKNGKVLEHSVGMQYVKLMLAMNSDSKYDAEEKAIWDKYYPIVANKETADNYGYFWAVTEAKVIEGSAVLFGSNNITPTISISEPSKSLTQEPSKDTQEQKSGWELFKIK